MEEVVERLSDRLRRNPLSLNVIGYKFRACPPTTKQVVGETEERLRFRLPQTLRQIYLTVANGGFGPGYGVMGVEGGFVDDLGHSVADLFEAYRQADPEDPAWQWPNQFLPICHWGCVIYSAVDCSQSPNPVYFVDVSAKDIGAPMDTIIKLHKPSFETWLSDWLDGKDLWNEALADRGTLLLP